jgi:hypothetical protein
MARAAEYDRTHLVEITRVAPPAVSTTRAEARGPTNLSLGVTT